MPAITFSGLSSGLDTASWVDALVSVRQTTLTSIKLRLDAVNKKQSTVSKLQTSFNTFRSAVEKITDSKFGSAFDIFLNNTAKSSNEDIFTATATKGATRQMYNVKVDQLATKTSVKAEHPVGAAANDGTKVSELGITKGSLTVYVEGKKNTINISEDDNIGDLKVRFAEAGINAEIDEKGQLSLAAQDGVSKILIGATNDSSNLKSILGLEKEEDGSYKSKTSMYQVTTSSKLTQKNIFSKVNSDGTVENTSITKGTFKIGDAEFTIDNSTTISGLVSKINATEDAGVTAYWDTANAKLVLTSKKEGHSHISIEAGTSNFTDIMGFTDSVWNEDGTLVSSVLKTDIQDLGKNAILQINGTEVISPSNVVTSDVTRMEGVTLTLKSVSPEDSEMATLDISQDTSEIVTAVKNFVDEYNNIMTSLSDLTKYGGDMYGDTTLNSIKKSIRQIITSSTGNDNDPFKMLAEVGISTAKAGADISADTEKLEFDESQLKKALSENPEAVKKLLMGTSAKQDGLLSRMEEVVDSALGATGFFTTTNKTIQTEISNFNKKIASETSKIDNYRESLNAKFQAMEKSISSMQKSYSNLLQSQQ